MSLLSPADHLLLLIDHEGQMGLSLEGRLRLSLRKNLARLGYFSQMLKVPLIRSTYGEKRFISPITAELNRFYPDAPIYKRNVINLWEDDTIRGAIFATGKRRLVMAGLWTDISLAFPVLSALKSGFEVYILTDASGSVKYEEHAMAIQRMLQASAVPLTTTSYISEILRGCTSFHHSPHADQSVQPSLNNRNSPIHLSNLLTHPPLFRHLHL